MSQGKASSSACGTKQEAIETGEYWYNEYNHLWREHNRLKTTTEELKGKLSTPSSDLKIYGQALASESHDREEVSLENQALKKRNKHLETSLEFAHKAMIQDLDSKTQSQHTVEQLKDQVSNLKADLGKIRQSLDRESRIQSELKAKLDRSQKIVRKLLSKAEDLETIQSLVRLDAYPTWSDNLLIGIRRKWETRHNTRYKNVRALLVCWASDDLGVMEEILTLKNVLWTGYEFPSEIFEIPDMNPSAALSSKVLQLLGDNSPDTLLIFYYGGHGYIGGKRHDNGWAATTSPTSPSMPSAAIQILLEDSRSDTILLYDACFSADTAMTPTASQNWNNHGLTELISSAGFDSTAPGVGQNSFTAALTIILKWLSEDNKEFSVSELYRHILERLKHSDLRYNSTHPFYFTLKSVPSGRQIILQPLLARNTKLITEKKEIKQPFVLKMSLVYDAETLVPADEETWREWILKAPPCFNEILYTQLVPKAEYYKLQQLLVDPDLDGN